MKRATPFRIHRGLVAEFATALGAAAALHSLAKQGYRGLDAFLPYPDEQVLDAIPAPRSPVPIVMLCAGLSGGALAYLIQWWTNAVDWPLHVGGKPVHSVPSMVPIVFETTVLFASFAGIAALFVLARLPRLWHPLFDVPGWESASVDRFWVAVDARDAQFDLLQTSELLRKAGAMRVLPVGEPQ